MSEELPIEPNPLAVSLNMKEILPTLLTAAMETLAFLSVPVRGEAPVHLIVHVTNEWASRMSNGGQHDEASAVVWELASTIRRMMKLGIPFPPFDITTDCVEPDCDVDHTQQTRLINDLFASAHNGRPQDAVQSYVQYVSQDPVDEWEDARVQYLAMLIFHTASRISEYRSSATLEMPSLGDLPTGDWQAHDYEPDHETSPGAMHTDAPCRVCGRPRRDCESRT